METCISLFFRNVWRALGEVPLTKAILSGEPKPFSYRLRILYSTYLFALNYLCTKVSPVWVTLRCDTSTVRGCMLVRTLRPWKSELLADDGKLVVMMISQSHLKADGPPQQKNYSRIRWFSHSTSLWSLALSLLSWSAAMSIKHLTRSGCIHFSSRIIKSGYIQEQHNM